MIKPVFIGAIIIFILVTMKNVNRRDNSTGINEKEKQQNRRE